MDPWLKRGLYFIGFIIIMIGGVYYIEFAIDNNLDVDNWEEDIKFESINNKIDSLKSDKAVTITRSITTVSTTTVYSFETLTKIIDTKTVTSSIISFSTVTSTHTQQFFLVEDEQRFNVLSNSSVRYQFTPKHSLIDFEDYETIFRATVSINSADKPFLVVFDKIVSSCFIKSNRVNPNIVNSVNGEIILDVNCSFPSFGFTVENLNYEDINIRVSLMGSIEVIWN